ncbi:MAG: metallophosphoesterase [Eubacteriales bacterium]|nr:metallophosphoesterase [Eubacteriales bacterium]
MKVLIISDTHRSLKNLKIVLEREGTVDMLIHLGDVERQMADIRQMVDCPIHMIAGNNDFLSGLPSEEEFEIGRYKVFITHGHSYLVNITEERLQDVARMLGADIVMYGHTHMPAITVEEDLITMNPGSLTYPRQSGRKPSYIVMTLDDAGEAAFEIRYL